MKQPDIDWTTLGFGYVPTDYNVRCYYRDGKWGEIEVSSSETIEMHIAATALHYPDRKSSKASRLSGEKTAKSGFSAPWKTPTASRNRRAASRWPKSPTSSSLR